MANLTLSIDEETLRRARIRALEQGTSVNSVVREYLEAYANPADAVAGRRRFVELARESLAGSDDSERGWTREGLYEERTRWPRS